jgi:hypothetical protein
VRVSAPLAHQGRTGLEHETGIDDHRRFLRGSGQALQAAPQRPAHAAIALLLQLIGEGADQQIATEPERRPGAIRLPPGKP